MSYDSTILAESSLISYWKLDEIVGTTAVDSTVSGLNNGTYTGGFTLNQSGYGSLTPSITLNGSTGYVDVPTAANMETLTDVSMEAWFKTSSNANQTIVGKYNNSGNNHGYSIEINPVNTGFLSIWCGATYANALQPVTDNKWHHVVATISSSGIAIIYIDGNQRGKLNVNQSLSTNQTSLKIGRRPDASAAFFNGNIMKVALYNAVLSQSAIQSHYQAVANSGALRITQLPRKTLITPTDQVLRITQLPVKTLLLPTDQQLRITQSAIRILRLSAPNPSSYGGLSAGFEKSQMESGFLN